MTTYSPLMLLRRHPQASTVRPRLLPGLSLTAVTYSPLAEPQAFRSISTKIRPTSPRAARTRRRPSSRQILGISVSPAYRSQQPRLRLLRGGYVGVGRG